jgi:hypothetical protein
MKIYKTDYGYHLLAANNVTVSFDSYEKERWGVTLFNKGNYAGQLNFDAATEFYKAWRAM